MWERRGLCEPFIYFKLIISVEGQSKFNSRNSLFTFSLRLFIESPWSGVAGSTSFAGHCFIPNRINCEELEVRWFCPRRRWRYFYFTELNFV